MSSNGCELLERERQPDDLLEHERQLDELLDVDHEDATADQTPPVADALEYEMYSDGEDDVSIDASSDGSSSRSRRYDEADPVERLTTGETAEPNARLWERSPYVFGGVVHEHPMTRTLLALTKPGWPAWTLVHSTEYVVDLGTLERRLATEIAECMLKPVEHPSSCDILFLVAKRVDGTHFPISARMAFGELDSGSLALIRSPMLKEAARRAMLGERRIHNGAPPQPQTPPTKPTLDDAINLAVVHARNIKVLEHTGRTGAVAVARDHDQVVSFSVGA